jgi:hypothetical protein
MSLLGDDNYNSIADGLSQNGRETAEVLGKEEHSPGSTTHSPRVVYFNYLESGSVAAVCDRRSKGKKDKKFNDHHKLSLRTRANPKINFRNGGSAQGLWQGAEAGQSP